MNTIFKNTIIILLIIFTANLTVSAAKTTKIKLTGTSYEPILMTLGQSGRTEVISSLPYTFEISKEELPISLKFQSQNYLYYTIDVPKKPFDTTGHVYLVKINENAMAMNNSGQNQNMSALHITQNPTTPPITGLDMTKGINTAPITGKKNEQTFALIISNEEYEMASHVQHATNDGLAFKEYCNKTLGIPTENIRYSANVSFGKMKKAFNDILELTELLNGEGNLIIYYAGHGIPDNKTKDAYLMPVDADGTDTDVCISLSSLYGKINSTNLNHCVVFLDACFSGAQRGGDMIVAARGVKLKPNEAAPTGRTIVFSATSDDEAAYAHNAESHGLFTYFLLSKLQETKGNVSLGDLASYVIDKVSFESRRINNRPQTPKVIISPSLSEGWKNIKLSK